MLKVTILDTDNLYIVILFKVFLTNVDNFINRFISHELGLISFMACQLLLCYLMPRSTVFSSNYMIESYYLYIVILFKVFLTNVDNFINRFISHELGLISFMACQLMLCYLMPKSTVFSSNYMIESYYFYLKIIIICFHIGYRSYGDLT